MKSIQNIDESSSATDSGSDLKRLFDRPWMIVLLVLHLGFLGIPLYWKTKYSVTTRLSIIALSIIYTVAAIIFIYVMIRYIINVLSRL